MHGSRRLSVVVEVTGEGYGVRQWKLKETVQWQPEEYINLLDVEDLEE